MDAKVQTKEFWSVIVNSVKTTASHAGAPDVIVEAQFVYFTRIIQGATEEYVPWYLTDATTPIQIKIPPWFFQKPVDKITARDVMGQFTHIFRKPIDIVPSKPMDIPLHLIPPVKRKAFVKAYKRMMESRFLVPPPGAGGKK